MHAKPMSTKPMFASLMKYNLRKSARFFIINYVAMLVSAVAGRLFAELGSTNFTFIMSVIFQGVCWAGVANLFINNLLRLWADSRTTLYGDEGYLYHAIPVRTSYLFWAKWLTALLILLMNLVVSAGAILLAYGEGISSMFDATQEIFAIIGIIALEIFAIFTEGILGIILEHHGRIRSRNRGLVYGLIAYLLSQAFTLVAIPVGAIFTPEILDIFTEPQGILDYDVVRTLLIVTTIAYVVVIATVSLISAHKINDGVNLE